MSRTALETHKLDLMAEISTLKNPPRVLRERPKRYGGQALAGTGMLHFMDLGMEGWGGGGGEHRRRLRPLGQWFFYSFSLSYSRKLRKIFRTLAAGPRAWDRHSHDPKSLIL